MGRTTATAIAADEAADADGHATVAPRRGRRSSRVVAAAVAALAVVLVATGGLASCSSKTPQLQTDQAERAVRTRLRDGAGITVTSVTCPDRVASAPGTTFTCTARVQGVAGTVPVEVRVRTEKGDVELSPQRAVLHLPQVEGDLSRRLTKEAGRLVIARCGEPRVRIVRIGAVLTCVATDGGVGVGLKVTVKDWKGGVDAVIERPTPTSASN